MQSRIEDIHAAGAEVLAISTDPVDAGKKLAADLNIKYPLLSDPDLKTIDAYGVRHPGGNDSKDIARAATFVVDRNGNIRWRDLKDNYRERVRPEQLLEALTQIP